ncbi:hypothetical protein [Bacillus suaedae]|uniref:Uncharacterized protein n=1 Tax=Halalkalibacter suaedae TaxID=2822140 RepID=A0A941AQ86_9BACI|nr:hypothetical protein [Bacillus suaedae]MBP3953620.1 hypothetical protein [Bacillus suaedae]
MEEPWYKIIEREVFFYLRYEAVVKDIRDEIEENQQVVSYPQSYVLETGEIVREQMGVEQQVIKRIEKHEFFLKCLKRAEERKRRLVKAVNQLNESDRQLVFTGNPIPTNILKRIYAIYVQERAPIDGKLKNEYMQQFQTGGVVTC